MLALGLAGGAAMPAGQPLGLLVARRKVSRKFLSRFPGPSFCYLNFLNELFYLNYNLKDFDLFI